MDIALRWDAGRSGATILARDRYSGQIVVIKFTDNRVPVYDKRRQELENEVQALQALQGHGVPQLLDYSEIREEALRYKAYYLTVKDIDLRSFPPKGQYSSGSAYLRALQDLRVGQELFYRARRHLLEALQTGTAPVNEELDLLIRQIDHTLKHLFLP